MRSNRRKPDRAPASESKHLTGWKEIACYLEVDRRTAQLWARQRSLPVRRLTEGKGVVSVSKDELNRWRIGEPQGANSGLMRTGRALRGWKAIANSLAVSIRTAQGWEHTRALPVHRFPGNEKRNRGSVFALMDALESWRSTSSQNVDLGNGKEKEVSQAGEMRSGRQRVSSDVPGDA